LVSRDSEYLFDLENDTWEINNLANNPKYTKVIEQFRKQLQNHLIEQKDVMFLPEGRFNEVQENTNLYEFRNNEKAYPIEQIVKTAMLSGLKTDKAIKAQINALSNPNQTVQYWAAMGLRGQETSKLKKNLPQIEKHLNSNSNFVGALVALALSNDLKHPRAVERLKEIILSDDEYPAYLVIQGLMYLTNPTDYDEVVSHFLEKRKGQKRFLMASNSAKMYQYVIGKKKISDIEE
jgi:hypothetical protein